MKFLKFWHFNLFCYALRCPIPSCKTARRKVKRLRPLPGKLAELSKETRDALLGDMRKDFNFLLKKKKILCEVYLFVILFLIF